MNEEKRLIKSCLYYEMFIERAHDSYIQENPDMQASGMRNLIMGEKGITVSFVSAINVEEQLSLIKRQMGNALVSYMAMPHVPGYIMDELSLYKDQVLRAVSSEELMKIVFDTLELTNIKVFFKQ